MQPFEPAPSEKPALITVPEFEISFNENSAPYQEFARRLEADLAKMVDRWLHVSAPCASRSGLGQTSRDREE